VACAVAFAGTVLTGAGDPPVVTVVPCGPGASVAPLIVYGVPPGMETAWGTPPGFAADISDGDSMSLKSRFDMTINYQCYRFLVNATVTALIRARAMLM
jgi:hypothetical protein